MTRFIEAIVIVASLACVGAWFLPNEKPANAASSGTFSAAALNEDAKVSIALRYVSSYQARQVQTSSEEDALMIKSLRVIDKALSQ